MDGCLRRDNWSILWVWKPPTVQGRRYRFRKPAWHCNLPTPPGCGAAPSCGVFLCESCREPTNNLNAMLSISAWRYYRGERTSAIYMPRQRMRRRKRMGKGQNSLGGGCKFLNAFIRLLPSVQTQCIFWTASSRQRLLKKTTVLLQHASVVTQAGCFASVCLMSPAGQAPTVLLECVREREGVFALVWLWEGDSGRKWKYHSSGVNGSVSAGEVWGDK